jgi:hypothetical protein
MASFQESVVLLSWVESDTMRSEATCTNEGAGKVDIYGQSTHTFLLQLVDI